MTCSTSKKKDKKVSLPPFLSGDESRFQKNNALQICRALLFVVSFSPPKGEEGLEELVAEVLYVGLEVEVVEEAL